MEPKAFTKQSLLNFLTELVDSAGDYLTAYITPYSFSGDSGGAAGPGLSDEIKEAIHNEAVLREASRYGTGAVIFWSEAGHACTILPSFPIAEDRIYRGWPETSPLRRLVEKERTLGMALVTLGSYALGVLKGDELVKYKTGNGHIHMHHRKGGRNEKRFARRTEEQKKDFLRRAANRIDEGFREYHLE